MVTIATAVKRIDALEEAVARIAEIHQPRGEYVQYCQTCSWCIWPCNTRRVLEGLVS